MKVHKDFYVIVLHICQTGCSFGPERKARSEHIKMCPPRDTWAKARGGYIWLYTSSPWKHVFP